MPQNLVSAQLSAEDQAAVMAAIQVIRQKLPFLIDLSPEDRQSLLKMGDKSRAFVSQTLEVAAQNENFLPRSFDLAEFRRDTALLNQLAPIATALSQVAELVDDTVTAVGSDAY